MGIIGNTRSYSYIIEKVSGCSRQVVKFGYVFIIAVRDLNLKTYHLSVLMEAVNAD